MCYFIHATWFIFQHLVWSFTFPGRRTKKPRPGQLDKWNVNPTIMFGDEPSCKAMHESNLHYLSHIFLALHIVVIICYYCHHAARCSVYHIYVYIYTYFFIILSMSIVKTNVQKQRTTGAYWWLCIVGLRLGFDGTTSNWICSTHSEAVLLVI